MARGDRAWSVAACCPGCRGRGSGRGCHAPQSVPREFPPGVLLHLECRIADDRINPAPGGSACRIEVFGISENLRECIVDDVLRTRGVVDDPARYRAQLVLLPGVDLADGRP